MDAITNSSQEIPRQDLRTGLIRTTQFSKYNSPFPNRKSFFEGIGEKKRELLTGPRPQNRTKYSKNNHKQRVDKTIRSRTEILIYKKKKNPFYRIIAKISSILTKQDANCGNFKAFRKKYGNIKPYFTILHQIDSKKIFLK